MKRINNIIYVAWLFLGMMGGCTLIHEEPADCQLYTPEGKPYAYVSVGFRTGMNTSTRADDDPTGGEDGDDNQAGTADENRIHDITLFFYVADGTAADKGVNSASTTPIAARHYFTSDQFTYLEGSKTATTEITAVEDLLVNTSYHVLADGTIRPVYFYSVDISEFSVNKLRDRQRLQVYIRLERIPIQIS